MNTKTYPLPTEAPHLAHIAKNLPTLKGFGYLNGLLEANERPSHLGQVMKNLTLSFRHDDEPAYDSGELGVDDEKVIEGIANAYSGGGKLPAKVKFDKAGHASTRGGWPASIVIHTASEFIRKGYTGYIQFHAAGSAVGDHDVLYRMTIDGKNSKLEVHHTINKVAEQAVKTALEYLHLEKKEEPADA